MTHGISVTGLFRQFGDRMAVHGLTFEVQPGSPAQAGGIEPGDVIVGLDSDIVTGIDDIARILDGSRIDKRVAIRFLRDGAVATLDIVPTERLG